MPANLKVLLWKNLKTEKRSWARFLGEIFAILLLCTLIIANPSRDLREFEPTKDERLRSRIYASSSLNNLNAFNHFTEDDINVLSELAYAPENKQAAQIVEAVASTLNLHATPKYHQKKALAKITFPNETINMNLTYRIRFPGFFRTFESTRLHSNLWLARCSGLLTNSLDEDEVKYTQTDIYIREGFLQLQHLIFMSWLEKIPGISNKQVIVNAQSFRYETKERLCHPSEVPNTLALFYHFIFFLPFLNLVWKYGREREKNLLAHHWRFGCSNFCYWWAHFMTSFLHLFLLSLLIMMLTSISWETKPKGSYKDPIALAYLLALLVLVICELIVAAITIVSLIPHAVNAIYFSVLLWVLIYAVFSIVLEYSVELESFWMIFSLVVFFNNDFAYGMRYLMGLDKETAENIWILYVIIIASIVIKLLICSVVQYYSPGRYVQRIPYPYFGLRKLFRVAGCATCFDCTSVTLAGQQQQFLSSRENYQFGPLHGDKFAIVARVKQTLTRFRAPPKEVLKKINLVMFRGEITVILGHYGTGKTTLISLLAGWRRPDEGSILLFEKDLGEDETLMRKCDVCMPNNALFDYLTSEETLRYYINLKYEKNRRTPDEEVKLWMKTVRMVFATGEEYTKLVMHMNFDQKRILTLCCAMACDTKIILLDEPTSKMSASEQRLYWSILQREKPDRAIIIATSSFREAETIADRIAIFTGGLLKACGTPMFLKTTFSIDHDLVIWKMKDSPSQPITDFLQDYVPDITPQREIGEEVVYKIPVEKRGQFQTLLIQLKKRRTEFGIRDVRLLTTDLSEVYMSLGRIKKRQYIPEVPQTLTIDYISKKHRIGIQWRAMFFKKFTHQHSTIIPIFMCLASILVIFVLGKMVNVLRAHPAERSSMILGFSDKQDSKILGNLKDCKFIGIQKVEIGNMLLRERSHSYTFQPHSFYCSTNRTFEEHLRKSSVMVHMYGALGINGGNRYTIYINQHILHSAPLVLNLLHNYVLQQNFPFNPDAVARVINDPVPIPTPHATGLIDSELEHLLLPLAIGIILPITICTFIFSLAEERSQSILMLMTIAGLRIDIYYLATLIWDWITFFVYSSFFLIVMVLAFYRDISIAHFFLIFLMFNIYSVPVLASIYFLSMFRYASQYRAYLIACVVHCTSGLFAFVIYYDVIVQQSFYLYMLLLSPTFALLDGVSNIYVLSKFKKNCYNECTKMETCDVAEICNSIPVCCEYGVLDWGHSGMLRSLIFLVLSTIIIILIMCWVEIHRRESKFFVDSRIKKMTSKVYEYDDDDIARMRQRIANAELRTLSKIRLVVDQVESKIPQKSMQLSTISFDVDKKTILAIYGTHRAGKSRLCRQIVGEDSFRFGDIYVRGIPVKYNPHDAWTYMGYSPQQFGVLIGFTVIEIFYFFCFLRGVPKGAIPTVVTDLSNIMGLGQVMRRRIRVLSRGTQRKICIAIAFVASNKLIILDEPTRGLPQWTRREIWNALNYMRSCGKTIVFTTTDMYECDALADNVLIIDDGEMLAHGGPHYLRWKHVVGFYLEIRLRRDGVNADETEENLRMDVDNLNRFMIFLHSDSVLINRVDNCLKFYIPVQNINFNILYGSLERNRLRLNIFEYTVGQGNFEEVLNNIAAKREHKRPLRLK